MGFSAGDPYLILKDCRGTLLIRTKVVRKTQAPSWEERGMISLVECRGFHVSVYDCDPSSDDLMTQMKYDVVSDPLKPLLDGKSVSGWLPLEKKKGEVRISIKPLFHRTAGALGVPNSRFPSRPGCRVTLFQSAHIGCDRDYLPQGLKVYHGGEKGFGNKRLHPQVHQDWHSDDNQGGARDYNPRSAWEELYVSILEAKHFIYIVGWSVNVEISMLRERNIEVPGYPGLDGTTKPLGEILQMKADEGVKVCMMLWREATSMATAGGTGMFESVGVAGTFSEQTKNFFRTRGGKVNVKTLLREAATALSLTKVAYTHHQKYVCLDAPALSGSSCPRRVICFVGGLDLTKGRFDTPRKHLWRTNGTWHKDDYYQNCFPGADVKQDCRQPWQDIHAKVEGAVARDFVTNFEGRWLKQTTEKWHKELFPVKDCRQIVPEDEDYVMDPDHSEAWNVQLFRSLDSTSSTDVIGIEGGIHNAYEHAITKANRFLYMENQYFMGGSKTWSSEVQKKKKSSIISRVTSFIGGEEIQAINRVPVLVMQRIMRAIRENKRFTTYVCIPMFPEGLPESAPMQEILYWQFRTMEMMYKHIKDALIAAGNGAAPTDYLNFFCLGNREPGPCLRNGKTTRPDMVGCSRRHMVYVHSKLLIADDDYVILGSANINDRSMAGDRDSEICIGAYQPYHSRDQGEQYPNGHVNAFRLSLWGEHLNEGPSVNPNLFYPESKECVDYINGKAERAWQDHVADNVCEQVCHLMKYPIVVAHDGSVTTKQREFPDAPGALIHGADSDTIPDFMTS
eukprot:TRINITY_DN32401_c0_g1_i2.p1 TRINITY_DN32401_c0_g1~~TRINITY_DN32401_c0_g1_i2.p1  ORF type:complete len:848 (+),score=327.63 TRINITY_DN32401_c0_g1_i2:169-2544(+)